MATEESSFLNNALASASAGMLSRLLTHPLDTAKARLQAPIDTPYKGVKDVLFRTMNNEGIIGLYRGFGAIVVGGTPGTMAYLCSYDWIRDRLVEQNKARLFSNVELPEFAIHFTSGMLAETIACIVYVPVDVIKERLQVQVQSSKTVLDSHGGRHYNGSLDALKKILQTEGLSGIYKGYGATLASFGPFSALYFVFYEKMKAFSRQHRSHLDTAITGDDSIIEQSRENNSDIELTFPYIVACSATAGAAASWITSPLDLAKLRLQIQRGSKYNKGTISTTIKYRGMLDCLSQIFKESGVRGIFRGAYARVLHFTPATMITMTCYEQFRQFYCNLLSSERHDY